ncbi:MAG: YicC/YloC family endoribonuclease [Acidiferrobacteraceae bacterium]
MIASMTGFARRSGNLGAGIVTCELRAVNHRHLEVSLRLPETLRGLEGRLRERITRVLQRGKIECSLRLEGGSGPVGLVLNEPLVAALCRLGHDLERREGLGALRAIDVLQWPGVFLQEAVDEAALEVTIARLVDETLDDLTREREREGEKLAGALGLRLSAIRSEIARLRGWLPALLPDLRARLRARIGEAGVDLDPVRLEQEIVLLAQRADVSEELDRLDAHLGEIERLLAASGPVGRRLDFMMQEVNREANTLGSKASDLRLTAASVEIKVLAEQMREQIQNIE